MKKGIYLVLVLSTYFGQVHANPIVREHVLSGFAQGTSYQVKYYSAKEIDQSDIDSVLNVIDISMSLYREGSLIRQFNSPETTHLRMDPHMRAVVAESFRIHKLSQGFFDITVFPLVELWGFGPTGFKRVPTSAQIDSVRRYVGMDKLSVEGDIMYKTDPRVQIDVNGIAQGYTVDLLGEYLQSRGVDNYIVELGGEIRVRGRKPDEPFKIMLDEINHVDPRYTKPVVVLHDNAITTSGIRERNYRVDEQLVSHHIDPVSGRPISNSNVSVTVIAPTAMLADALDNYLMYLNPHDAVTFVEELPGVEMCLYYQEANQIKVVYSSGFNNYLYN